jgi:pimeloyl-ACP methyl ester carboxylesterase
MATPALAERFLDTSAGRIRYLHGGTGPALVLCHGFLGSAENFDAWFESLLPVRTLVVPDLPGCGATPPLRGLHTSSALAAALEPLLADLRLDEPQAFDLGGLCLGGGVACALMARRPERVRRLVVHTPLLAPALVRRRFHVQVGLMTAPGLYPAIAWLSHRRVVSDLYKRLLVEGDDVDQGAAEANFRNQLRADPRATREWLRDGLRRDDARLVLGREGPTLLIAAESDRICDVEGLRTLAARDPHVELAVEKGGHGWTEASVAWQTGVLRRFLAAA